MRFFNLLAILCFSIITCFSQNKLMLPDFDKKVILLETKGLDDSFEQTDTIMRTYLKVKTFDKAKVLISEIIYNDTNRNTFIGDYKYFFSNGNPKIKGFYNTEGKLDGKLKSYFINGVLKRDDSYKNGLLVTGKCFDSTGKEINYFPYETLPMQDLDEFYKCLVYPENLRKNNIEGELIFKLAVDNSGQITEVNYSSKYNQEFVDATMKCINKIIFVPVYIDGEAKSFVCYIPVKFKLK